MFIDTYPFNSMKSIFCWVQMYSTVGVLVPICLLRILLNIWATSFLPCTKKPNKTEHRKWVACVKRDNYKSIFLEAFTTEYRAGQWQLLVHIIPQIFTILIPILTCRILISFLLGSFCNAVVLANRIFIFTRNFKIKLFYLGGEGEGITVPFYPSTLSFFNSCYLFCIFLDCECLRKPFDYLILSISHFVNLFGWKVVYKQQISSTCGSDSLFASLERQIL